MSEERQLAFKMIQCTKYLFERRRQNNTKKLFTVAKAKVWERKQFRPTIWAFFFFLVFVIFILFKNILEMKFT